MTHTATEPVAVQATPEPITQRDLQDLQNVENLASRVLDSIAQRLEAGAAIEPGPLCIRPGTVRYSRFVAPCRD